MREDAVWIAPLAFDVPDGRMVHPETSAFLASWQWHDDAASQGAELEAIELVGAEGALAWARQRSDRVLIRLGHTSDTYFSAGRDAQRDLDDDDFPLPRWPPASAPPEGWWVPSET